LGHVLFGDFQLDIAGWLLVGAIPGVYVGARLSATARDDLIRPALVVVLVASGLKLVDVPTPLIGVALVALTAIALLQPRLRRRRTSQPPSAAGDDDAAAVVGGVEAGVEVVLSSRDLGRRVR
jgi:uncharacterized membrane protein YfcA